MRVIKGSDEHATLPAVRTASGAHRGRTWALVLICLTVIASFVVFVVILLTPSFTLWNASTLVIGDRQITESYLVENSSMVDQRIDAVDLEAPGIHIVRTDAPLVIPSGSHRWVRVTYEVTDCKAAVAAQTGAPFAMDLRLDRWWGVHTETVADHGLDYPGPYDVCR